MNKRFFRHKFYVDQSGIALTEGLIVFPFMLAAIALCIEMGMMMTQWNLFAKSAQVGVRKLVVSQPIVPVAAFDSQFAFDDSLGGAEILPNANNNISCTGTACPNMTWFLFGADGPLADSADQAWGGITRVFPGIRPEHVTVTYETSGLGYQGRPAGPVVSVKVEINGDAFQIPLVSSLMDIADIDFPSIKASATSEDLSTCARPC